MKKLIKSFLLCSTLMYAALPPQYQHKKDYDALYDYVENHPKVKRTLNYINEIYYIIGYSNSCEIHFEREKVFHMDGWVGPAEKLIFKEDTCLTKD